MRQSIDRSIDRSINRSISQPINILSNLIHRTETWSLSLLLVLKCHHVKQVSCLREIYLTSQLNFHDVAAMAITDRCGRSSSCTVQSSRNPCAFKEHVLRMIRKDKLINLSKSNFEVLVLVRTLHSMRGTVQ